MKKERKWWLITVGDDWGSMAFWGTEDEAEDCRSGKAEWEGTWAKKEIIDSTHPKVKVKKQQLKIFIEQGCKPEKRELESLKN